MKIKLFLTVALPVIFCHQIFAQTKIGKISGLVRDDRNMALSGVTVLLNSNADTALKTTRITDNNGAFIFKNLAKGSYIVTCSGIGFNKYVTTHLIIGDTNPAIVLPVIVLQPSNKQLLKEVIVIARKPLVEQKIDRTIVNVDAMISAAGSNALEVLSKSPGVIVDANDNISLNGKSNVLVLIDDRPTYMGAQDLAAYLKSLPGGMLDKLELISNPPARYDAAGGAIINIVLKKNKLSGFNGGLNLAFNQGVYARSNDAANVNYRNAKFNIFGSLGYGHDKNYSNETYNRYFYNYDGSLSSSILQNSHYSYQSNAWNGRVGMDYFVSANTTLGIIFTGNTRPKTDGLDYLNKHYNDTAQPDSTGKGSTNGKYQSKNAGLNLNLQHKFDSAGRILAVDFDYINYNSASNQVSPAYVYLPDGSLETADQRVFTFPSNVRIYAIKADYSHPLPGKTEFNTGIKSSFVTTDNHSNWFNQQNNMLVPDYSQTNHFRYSEDLGSAYINLKKEWPRWGAQAGLRLEHTSSKGRQFANPAIPDSAFTRQYINLFPSFYLSYKLDNAGSSQLVISYNKRIHRPNYQQLNPFLFYHDQYSYSSGNPGLVPDFSQFFELRYTYKQYFGITTGYWTGSNGISPVTTAAGDIFTTRPANFIQNRTYSLVPYFSLNPAKWWELHLNLVLLYIVNRGNADGVILNQKTNVHEIETSNIFQWGDSWTAELNGFFPGKQTFGQSTGGSVYNISAGLQKSILNRLGTIRINANDIFNTMINHSQTTAINQVSAFSTRRTDTRRIGVSFSYRFGKAANARKRNNNGSAEDEKGRAN